MHRNAHPTAPAGHHTDGDPLRGVPPTVVPAATMEALQEELANFIESRGIKLKKDDNTQLKQAILDAISRGIQQGDFVTKSEFQLHTQGGDPHQQYALESMLGEAAKMNVGSTGGTVASGDHAHAQYELKTNLKQAAYRDVGRGPNQVATGDHTHSEFLTPSSQSFAKHSLGSSLSFGVWRHLATIWLPKTLAKEMGVRVSLPFVRVEENGRGANPGCDILVGVNGANVTSSRIHIPADRYGNGLSYGATPIGTLIIPAGTTNLTISVLVSLTASMQNPSIADGVVVAELIDLHA